MWVYCSVTVFLLPRREHVPDWRGYSERRDGALAAIAFPPETTEGRGHVLGSMAETVRMAVASLPRAWQDPLSHVLTLTTTLTFTAAVQTPLCYVVSLANLWFCYAWKGTKRSPWVRYFLPLSLQPNVCNPVQLHSRKGLLFWATLSTHCKDRAVCRELSMAQS